MAVQLITAVRATPARRARVEGWVLALVSAGVVEQVLLAVWQQRGYWDFSDGVYAETARVFVHGHALYRDIAAAQPPGVYMFGALVLSVSDGVGALRGALGAVDLVTAGLVALAVYRLSGSRVLSAIGMLLAPLLPLTLHEHAQLVPETLAAPLLIAGAICAASRQRAHAAGGLLALAVAFKLAFGLPAVAISLATRQRRRTATALVATGIVLAAVGLLVFGTGLWRETVIAQLQVGDTSVVDFAGLVVQGGWNELPLIIGATTALALRRRARDPDLLQTLAAAAIAGALLLVTVLKRGSYITVLAAADPALLVLAACGVSWAWQQQRVTRYRGLVAVLTVFLAAQSVSLLIAPRNPVIARRPFARSGLGYSESPSRIDDEVTAARRCRASTAYSGSPYVAFLANRPMPGDQPDLFIIRYAAADAAFARQAAADATRCP